MFDVCQSSVINQEKGIIYSPGYPSHRVQSTLCVTQINVPAGKSLNIWITDMSIKGKDLNQKYIEFYSNDSA